MIIGASRIKSVFFISRRFSASSRAGSMESDKKPRMDRDDPIVRVSKEMSKASREKVKIFNGGCSHAWPCAMQSGQYSTPITTLSIL